MVAFVALWGSMDITTQINNSSNKKAEYDAALRKLMLAILNSGKPTVVKKIVDCEDKIFSCRQEKIHIAKFVKRLEINSKISSIVIRSPSKLSSIWMLPSRYE